VSIEIVAPVSADAAQALPFDRSFQPQDDPAPRLRPGGKRFAEIEMAGDLQRRSLASPSMALSLAFEKGRNFLFEPVRHGFARLLI